MSVNAEAVLAPSVKLNGADLSAAWLLALTEVRIELEFQLPGRCTLRFADPGYALLASGAIALGDEIEVTMRGHGSLISAEITGVAVDEQAGSAPELVIVAHDKAHRMSRSTKVSTYLEMTYSAIVTKIAQANGLRPQVTSSTLKMDYLMQVDSDMGLITELANRLGYDWWVEGTTLHFAPPNANGPQVILKLHEELEAFSVRATGHRPDGVEIKGWDRKRQQALTSKATTTEAKVKPSSTLADMVAKSAGAFTQSTLLTAGTPVTSQDEVALLSNALRDRLAASAVTARGTVRGGNAIKPGVAVKVENAGPLSGKYHVTKVDHVYRLATGLQTRFVAGDRTPTSLVDTLGGARSGGGAALHHAGLVVGEVTNINDPDKRGRVKVRYPGLSGSDESAWARLVAPGGGKSRGSVFIPEVGDEVLVGFEGGDLRQPVVIGGLYGDKSTIPEWTVANGAVSARRMTSRLGHVMELADGTGETDQHVLLKLAGGQHKFRLGKDRVDLEVPAGKPVSIKAGGTSIVFGADGAITIEGANITIKAKNSLTLEGVQVSVKAKAQLALEGSAQAGLKGATVQIEGSGMTAVKGGIVQIN